MDAPPSASFGRVATLRDFRDASACSFPTRRVPFPRISASSSRVYRRSQENTAAGRIHGPPNAGCILTIECSWLHSTPPPAHRTRMGEANDPSNALPRDDTGSYLHLKLKRFPSIKELSMPYAKKTWVEHPQDADVDMAPSNRSKCRQCHSIIQKGDLRVRLWLQCHKGCKNSAYFHGKDCLWRYPETRKLESVNEFSGINMLPKEQQKYIEDEFKKRLPDDKNAGYSSKRTKQEEGNHTSESVNKSNKRSKKTMGE